MEEALCVHCKWEEDINKLPYACQSCSDHYAGVCMMPEAYNLAKAEVEKNLQKLYGIEELINFCESCETCQGFSEYPISKAYEDIKKIIKE